MIDIIDASVGNLTVAALVSPLVSPPELEYPPPRPLPRILEEYRHTFVGHPTSQWVADMYRRHRGPSAEICG